VSTPSVPGFGHGVSVIFRMQMRRLVRGRKLRVGIIASIVVMLAVVAARYAGDSEVGPERAAELAGESFQQGLAWGFFGLIAFVFPFLFTASAIPEEIESRTLAYLVGRPTGRFSIAFGKYLAGATLTIGLVVGMLLLMHVALYVTEPTAMVENFPQTLKAIAALTLLCAFYCAVCMLWGALLPEATGIVSVLYFAVIEFIFSFMPSYFRCISMSYLAQEMVGLEKRGLTSDAMPGLNPPDVPAYIGASVIAIVTLVFLGLAAVSFQGNEYRYSKA